MKTLALRLKQAAEVSRSIAKLDPEMRGIVLRDALATAPPIAAKIAKIAAKRGPGRPKGSKNRKYGKVR